VRPEFNDTSHQQGICCTTYDLIILGVCVARKINVGDWSGGELMEGCWFASPYLIEWFDLSLTAPYFGVRLRLSAP